MKRLREFFENIAYAGLKPSGQKVEVKKDTAGGRLREKMERLLAGGPGPTDPLYLTNRPFSQKIRPWLIVGIPLLIVLGAIGISLSNLLEPPVPKVAVEPTAKELAAKILPNFDKNLKLDRNNDIEVVEAKIEHTGGTRLVGTIRNTTDHEVPAAHMVFDLTDVNGSQVGGVEVRVENIPASKTKEFSAPLAQQNAAFALVREVGPVK